MDAKKLKNNIKAFFIAAAAIAAFIFGILAGRRTTDSRRAVDTAEGRTDSNVDKLRHGLDADRLRAAENRDSLENRAGTIEERQGATDGGLKATRTARDIIRDARSRNRELIEKYRSGTDKAPD